jgi:predicted ATPase
MGLASEFRIEPIDRDKRFYETRVKITPGGTDSSLIDVGFGISQVLPVLTMLLSAPEDSIILLEQPELHLHPSAQAHLADLFLHVAETRHLQLIIESHSEHILSRLQRRIAEAQSQFVAPDNIKMYFCQPGADGSTIQPVQIDKYGQIANWPPNFFGDIAGDLDAMAHAALEHRRQELSAGG